MKRILNKETVINQKTMKNINSKGFVPIIVIAFVAVIALAMVGVGIYFKVENDKQIKEQKNTNSVAVNTNTETNTNTTNQNANTNTATDETAGWQTYENKELGIIFGYPKSWGNVKEDNGNISFQNYEFFPYIDVTSFQELRDGWEELFTIEECLTNCGTLKDDRELFNHQFDILKEVGKGRSDDNLKQDIEDYLIIFSEGIDMRLYIEIQDKNKVKIIGNDGFGTDLSNLYYRAVIVKGEKIAIFHFLLFEGQESKYGEELGNNFDKILNDLADFVSQKSNNLGIIDSVDKEFVRNRIKTYDQVLSTFQFTD